MNKHLTLLATLLVLPVTSTPAADWFVDDDAAPGGDGSASRPFQTINEAASNAASGDVITVREGTYREALRLFRKEHGDTPVTFRAAEGERVILSGFDPIEGWEPVGNGNFAITLDQPIADLFTGMRRLRVARSPNADQAWIPIASIDESTGTIVLERTPETHPDYRGDLALMGFSSRQAVQAYLPILSIKPETNTVRVRPGLTRLEAGDPVFLCNSASFVDQPGEWACQPVADGKYRLLYRPENERDLLGTATRTRDSLVRVQQSSGFVFKGLEVVGAALHGFYFLNASDIRVEDCLIYNNGLDKGATGTGIRSDQTDRVLIDSCIVFSNHTVGINVTQGSDVLIRGCEVTQNTMDGFTASGRRNQPEAPLRGITLENSHIHNHLNLGHPDNTQMYNHVRGVAYRNNLLVLAGQNFMVSETEGLTFEGNVFFGALARHVILGHNSVHDATFERNTFGFAQYGAIGTANVRDFRSFRNVFYNNSVNYEGPVNFEAGGNTYFSSGKGPLVIRMNPTFSGYDDPAEFAREEGFETGSSLLDPDFANVPEAQAEGGYAFLTGALDSLQLNRPEYESRFSLGDIIEINGDGVARRVTGIEGGRLSFEPALAAIPFRAPIIWNWGDRTDFTLDLESPLVGGQDQPGSPIDTVAYAKGDLLGTGQRTLPPMPEEATQAMTNPNNFIFPFYLPKRD